MGEKIEDSLEVVGDTLYIYRRVCVPNPVEFIELKFEVEREDVSRDEPCSACNRLSQEFICGVVRHRGGIDEGELDYQIRMSRAEKHIDEVIAEVEGLLKRLKEIQIGDD